MARTHQDIITAADENSTTHWWTGSETPEGTFAVGTVIGGKVRTYLCRGAYEGDLNASIIGQSVCDLEEIDGELVISEPSYYAGGALFGGIYLDEARNDHDAMRRMVNLEHSRV